LKQINAILWDLPLAGLKQAATESETTRLAAKDGAELQSAACAVFNTSNALSDRAETLNVTRYRNCHKPKMVNKVKALLRKSRLATGSAEAIRGGILDIRILYWCAIRPRAIRAYLENDGFKGLQIGTGNGLTSSWLNTDLLPTKRDVVYLDATRRFPVRDDQFDYVFSEHMIEHIDYKSGMLMLSECFRVLKPAGRICIATPNLEVLLGLYRSETTTLQQRYLDWVIKRNLPSVTVCKEVFVLNNAFRGWGHTFLYDHATLSDAMRRVGFRDIKLHKPGDSNEQHLRGLEKHGELIGSEEINQFVTLVIEGKTPNPKRDEAQRTAPAS
jgi:predicted SAM-dependent methyltransferase